MKKIALVTLFFIFSSAYLIAQEKAVINKMIEEVTFLASDQLEGRETGTQSEEIAAKYIRYKFRDYGLLAKGSNGYFQYFKSTIKSHPHSNIADKKINGINVVGYLDNSQKFVIKYQKHMAQAYHHFLKSMSILLQRHQLI